MLKEFILCINKVINSISTVDKDVEIEIVVCQQKESHQLSVVSKDVEINMWLVSIDHYFHCHAITT